MPKKLIPPTFNTKSFVCAKSSSDLLHLKHYLLELLESLRYIEQSPRYHPEGDALFHSLQTYQYAQRECNDSELLAAALLHDVGKAIDYPNHDKAGADALSGLLSRRVVWLIEHHLDLLISPQKTRRQLAGTQQLVDLEKLRRWDLAGRNPHAIVGTPGQALDDLFSQNIVTE